MPNKTHYVYAKHTAKSKQELSYLLNIFNTFIFKSLNMYFLIVMFSPMLLLSQSINLDSIAYAQEKALIIQAHEYSAQKHTNANKSKWLNLLPSISYNAQSNSVNVGINLNSFSQYYQLRQRNKIAMDDLLSKELERIRTDRINTLALIQLYNQSLDELALVKATFAIDTELFAIKKAEYDNNKITLVQFLNAKKSFIQSQKQLDKAAAISQRQLEKLSQILNFQL